MNTKKKRSKNKRITKGKGRLKVVTINRVGRTINRVTAPHDPKVKDSSSSKKKGLKERVKIKTKKILNNLLPKKLIPKKLKVSSPSNVVFRQLEKNTKYLFETYDKMIPENKTQSPLTPLENQVEKLKIQIKK